MSWTVDRSKILQPDEIHAVLTDLRRKARRSTNTKMNLTVFRLATCCGLRQRNRRPGSCRCPGQQHPTKDQGPP